MTANEVRIYVTKAGDCGSGKEKQRHSYLGRELLYYGLGELFEIDRQEILVEKAQNGKPYLVKQSDIHFNISHSKDYVVCAIALQSVGIDIQFHKEIRLEGVAKRALSEAEYKRFVNADDPQLFFYESWAKKESFIKWTGEGLRKDLRTLHLTGYVQRILINDAYSCAICSKEKLDAKVKFVERELLLRDKGE